MAEKLIDDFGKKIGGARKDYANKALNILDLSGMTSVEKLAYVKRDNIWKKPDFQKMYESGVDPLVIWYINNIRVGVNPKVQYILDPGKEDNVFTRYISYVEKIRDKAMTLRNVEDIGKFKDWVLEEFYDRPGYWIVPKDNVKDIIGDKLLKNVQLPYGKCEKKASEALLGVPEDKIGEVRLRYMYRIIPYDETCMSWHEPEVIDYGEGAQRRESLCIRVANGMSYYYSDFDPVEIHEETKRTGYLILRQGRNEIVAAGVAPAMLPELKKRLSELLQQQYESAEEFNDKCKEKAKARKKDFPFPHLEHLKRTGEDYAGELHVKETDSLKEDTSGQISMCFDETPDDVTGHAEGQDYLDTFHFRGGEFGNWVNQEERQKCLDLGYNALKDLAVLLNIEDKDVSLGGNLSIAFGARGHGRALAHYEPMRQVINLTRLKGAGSLAHEWFHALDRYYNYVGHPEHVPVELYSDTHRNFGRNDKPFDKLITAMKYKYTPEGRRIDTDFYTGSKEMDKSYRSGGHGYWSSDCEMLARAFACYIEDKMKERGIVSDYLSNHADCYGNGAPCEDERKVIYQHFDDLFDDLRERGILHKREDGNSASISKKSLSDVKKNVAEKKEASEHTDGKTKSNGR